MSNPNTTNVIAEASALTAPTAEQNKTALKVALGILGKWNCSEQEKIAMLGIGRSTLHKYQSRPETARLSADLLERISYILNIHQSLRTLFDNPENIYGFVRKQNQHPFFNGATPMDIMRGGRVAGLYDVFRHVDALRGGQW